MGFWTEEKMRLLADNCHTRSATWVAEQLGTTRSTVIGKAHRMGLSFAKLGPPAEVGAGQVMFVPVMVLVPVPVPYLVSPCPPRLALPHEGARGGRSRTPPPQPQPGKDKPVLVLPEAPAEGVLLIDLEDHHCRWQVGVNLRDEALFCGRKKFDSRYCEEHADTGRGVLPPPSRTPLRHNVRRY